MDGQTALCLVFASFSDGRWHIYDSTGRTISWCVGVGALGRGLLGVNMRRCVLGDWEGSSRAMDATNPGQVVMVATAFVLVLPTIPMFLSSWQLLKPVYVWFPWLIFGLVNPVLEEWYWRGSLLDATRTWSSWITIPGTSVLFSLDHLWSKGVTSVAERNPVFLIYAFVFGLVFGIVYKKTRSLRWPVVAHALADLLGLSVPVFLKLWVPPGR